jgi:hypothetical protein
VSATADTQLQIFKLKRISAASLGTYGEPLVIRVESQHGDLELILYTDNKLLSDLVASAINDAVALAGGAAKEPPCPFEHAAYQAASYAYNGGSR